MKWAILCATLGAALMILFGYGVPLQAQEQGAAPAEKESVVAPKAEPATKAEPAAQEPKKEEPAAKPAAAAKKAPEELTNQQCMDCHNPDILKLSKEDLAEQVAVEDKPVPPRPKPLYITGELNLAIKEKAYADGVHADTTCVTCHKDVTELPHAQRLKIVDCKECHEDSVDTVKASAHGEKAGPKAVKCIGCHDVHYGKGMSAYVKDFERKTCADCHKAYGMDTVKGHQKIYEARMHLAALDCMICHQGDKAGVHFIPSVKKKVAGCEACHNKVSILSKQEKKPVSCVAYLQQTGFINSDIFKKYNYVIGAHRIPALDAIVILAVLAPLGLPIVHGGLRILTRRKGPVHLPEEKILLHPLVERLWHWFQALCIVMLIITGIILHWPEKFSGWFQWAVDWHNWFGWAVVIAWLVWFVYNTLTGRMSHYIPKKGEIPRGMITQAKFYGYGIFKHEPHPYAPSEDNKFNPLQKIAYLKFQLLLFPLLLLSGLMYMYPEIFKGFINAIGGLTVLAVIHYILGALFAAFLVAHMYLATTGETVGENFKAIITGYGVKSEHDVHHV
jgi:thiosulfate reductase cytochrome b subunit